jgi:hypothetical protein
MLPPQWATASGKRLSMNDFVSEFVRAWSKLTKRSIKLECWQNYREQEFNRSQDVFMAGDIESATRLLKEEAEEDRSLYEEIKSRKLDHTRIRLVKKPLTPYLEYELISYKIRLAMGENIEIVLFDGGIPLPSTEFFDFLLFDDSLALVHDYGTDGFQVGGWLTEEPEVIRRLEEIAVDLRSRSSPLAEFLRTANV